MASFLGTLSLWASPGSSPALWGCCQAAAPPPAFRSCARGVLEGPLTCGGKKSEQSTEGELDEKGVTL